MNELQIAIKVLMANATVMYYKAHQFHWNVEGIEFTQYHTFFEDIYTDVYNSIDPIAELLRKLDTYTPISLDELFKYKTLSEEANMVTDLGGILSKLSQANDEVITSLNKVFTLAAAQNQQGICNFIADRIDTHQKHGWFLRASAKR
jgi:starvation-inducible DNA-binding protein